MIRSFNKIHQEKMLTAKLRHFGLDPQQWTLVKQNSRSYRIQDTSDPRIFLMGAITKTGQKLEWKHIQITDL